MIKVAIIGHGVVGSGVAEILNSNKDGISRRAGNELSVSKILDLRDFPGLPYSDVFTKKIDDILYDNDIKIVAEAMGGTEPAYTFVKSLLEKGKSVVTSNKELVAAKGAKLLKIAKENNVNFFFEASVGGGIPIIRPLHQCLAANEIYRISGILNGTTNFIMTKMIREGVSFDEALKTAQELGYAEKDPSADIDGHDTCRKICILASLAFGHHIYPEQVETVGIRGLSLKDIAHAEKANKVIKLIGNANKLKNGKIFINVSPALLDKSSQLANINDVFNGILVEGDATGDVVFYGKGAGKLPTASAVVADMIDCAKSFGTCVSLNWEDDGQNHVEDYSQNISKFYIRSQIFDQNVLNIKIPNIDWINSDGDEMVFITPEITGKTLDNVVSELGLNVMSKFEVR